MKRKSKIHLSDFTKGVIIGHYSSGKTIEEISKILKILRSTVGFVTRKFSKESTTTRKIGSKRLPKFSSDQKNTIQLISRDEPSISAASLSEITKTQFNVEVFSRTIGRILNSFVLHARVAKLKPLLTSKNIESRWLIAKKFLAISDEEWKKVMFFNESCFEVYISKIRIYNSKKTVLSMKSPISYLLLSMVEES
ncbi:uncharacterized protein LOC115230198 [Octopus sinensis]|uniref:Uncharacterized protein LOC115230198 n=1 Tax=Octopus sinensis TaxID=2607531 RepID=A0A6P7U1Y5_9MOLL|nr:uncharacterized protein LOC115230198 [Octopus sinensis]